MPPLSEILAALPVIASLVVIEGLLSVDNALAIAALASHLPEPRQKMALRLGILGAYLFRGLAMYFVALIIANPWLKMIGAAYLLYLMVSHLLAPADEDAARTRPHRGLWLTILQIEAMDLTLSLDNVVAAVALDRRLWVVCTGVFLGILTLRFLAGWCIRLLVLYPVLGQTAFLLIGFVGVILVIEVGSEWASHPVQITSVQKFAGIVAVVTLSLWQGRHRAPATPPPARGG